MANQKLTEIRKQVREKKIYLLPNLVTAANIFCGFFSMIQAFNGNYVQAAWLLVLAGVFDALDGRIARMAKATSEFGVQFDSLSDLTSFGMAPAILIYLSELRGFGKAGTVVAFLFLICAALRLARFNVRTQICPKGYFEGVPSPVAAGTLFCFVIFKNHFGWQEEAPFSTEVFALVLTGVLALLMVSVLRFPSFKEINWRSRASFGYLLIGVGIVLAFALEPETSFFLILLVYLVTSIFWNLYLLKTKRWKSLSGHSEKETETTE